MTVRILFFVCYKMRTAIHHIKRYETQKIIWAYLPVAFICTGTGTVPCPELKKQPGCS